MQPLDSTAIPFCHRGYSTCSRCCVGVGDLCDLFMQSILRLALFFDLSDMCRSFWPRSAVPNMIIHRVYRDIHKTDGQGGGQGRREERRGKGGGRKSCKCRWSGRREYTTHLAMWLVKRRNAELRKKGWKTSRKDTRGDKKEKCYTQVRGTRLSGFCILLWTLEYDLKVQSIMTAASRHQMDSYSIQHHTSTMSETWVTVHILKWLCSCTYTLNESCCICVHVHQPWGSSAFEEFIASLNCRYKNISHYLWTNILWGCVSCTQSISPF